MIALLLAFSSSARALAQARCVPRFSVAPPAGTRTLEPEVPPWPGIGCANVVPVKPNAATALPPRIRGAESAAPPFGPLPTGVATIATPAPNAPMEKVEEAKDIAHAAALTPLVPSPKDPLRPAFQLYAEVDLPILAAGIVFTAARLFRSQPAYCAPKCDPAELNALDRTTAGTWGPPWAVASNYALYGLMGGSALALIVDEGPLAGLNDLVVVAESAMSATGLAAMLTLASGRPRPYLYGDDAPLTERNSPDAGLSFLSGHTTVSFAIVTSTYFALQRIHPNSRWPLLALGLGGGGAAFVGVSRVMAGKHFITDVLGGAVVGSSVGVLVSSLHGSPVRIVPVVSDLQKGVDLMGTF